MFISEYLKINKRGHENYDFVDCQLDNDNKVFIDPILLKKSNELWSLNAVKYLISFENCLYKYLDDYKKLEALLSHAHEQNATKLGYGNGFNGKGKTSTGLMTCFSKLINLKKDIPTICKIEDIPILVEGFAEDFMSDMLTNILHKQLNEFTAEQMEKFNVPPNGELEFWTWDIEIESWKKVKMKSWIYKGKEILMVPKYIVRKNYLFRPYQYLYGVIVERMKVEKNWNDMRKVDIIDNLPKAEENWIYTEVINYTKKHPDALVEYHLRIPKYYNRANGLMSDDDLDETIYINKIA